MFSQAVSQTVGVESGSAAAAFQHLFRWLGVWPAALSRKGVRSAGVSCEREGAGGLDMGEGCAGASVSSSKDAAGRP